MQAMREKMRAARKAEAEKMKSILTTEQFMQWSQMQGARVSTARLPSMKAVEGQEKGAAKDCPRKKGKAEIRG